MRFRRLFAVWTLGLLGSLGGCQPMEDFATLQPLFFPAVNLFDSQSRQDLPQFEQRMDRLSAALQAQLDRGELTDPVKRAEAGRAFIYGAFVYITTHHAVEDGYLSLAEATVPHRFAAEPDDRSEQLARMGHAADILQRAQSLLPDDPRISSELLSTQLNRELFAATPSQQTLDAWIALARKERFGLFTALVLFRDPERFPLDSPHMEQLLSAVCSPAPVGFDCNRMGPPPPPDPQEPPPPRWMTTLVAGPVLLSDFLARRAESLVARADKDPAQAMPALGEAMGRIQVAAGSLQAAMGNMQADDVAGYPAKDTLAARKERLDAIQAAVGSRLTGMPALPLPEAKQYYASPTYRAAYQCASCHLPRPNLPESFLGVPK